MRMVRLRWVVIWSLAAAGLFLGSAVLQFIASLQRWVFSDSQARNGVSADDHLFDYSFPRDPWENIGTAAQFFGAGTLVLALGVLAMAVGVVAMPSAGARPGIVIIVAFAVIELALALLVAGGLGINGAHALLSGMTGVPSSLKDSGALGWSGMYWLIILGGCWLRRSQAAAVACLFLIGATELGYVVAAFMIAPIFAGGISYDTTRWTETVVAASTAAAGVAMLLAARATARRNAPSAVHAHLA